MSNVSSSCQGAESVDVAVSASTSGIQAPSKDLRIAVVYITDGNADDCRRMAWSMRTLSDRSRMQFDSFILTPPRTTLPREVTTVSPLSKHGLVRQLDDMEGVLSTVSISPAGWNRSWSFVVLYRLGLPMHDAFREYDRVLYLDTDTLVLSDRIDLFLAADLDGYEVGGVVDTVQEMHNRIHRVVHDDLRPDFSFKMRAIYGDELELKPYVNAGVLLWNLSAIRADMPWYIERLRMFWEAECRGLVGFLDQDFVNVMMRVKTGFSMVYNWFTDGDAEAEQCVVRHYCGPQRRFMAAKVAELGLCDSQSQAAFITRQV